MVTQDGYKKLLADRLIWDMSEKEKVFVKSSQRGDKASPTPRSPARTALVHKFGFGATRASKPRRGKNLSLSPLSKPKAHQHAGKMVTDSDGSQHLILAGSDTPGGRNRHTVILKQPTPVGIDGEAQPTQRLSEKSDRDSGTIEVESKLCLTGGTPTVCSPIAAGRKTLQPITELAKERPNAAEERAS